MNQHPTVPILEARGIRKVFTSPIKVDILKGIDLAVHGGESIAIMGRSGQGKSTLLQILGTLDKPTQGALHIKGQPVTPFNVADIRRSAIAFVFQSYFLLEDYTVLENVLIPARIDRQDTSPGSTAYCRAMELLEMVELTHRADFNTKLLSGGEKQRTAIARSLCNNPSLIFADEPSGNLDNETAGIIHKILLDFAKQPDKAMILVTHDNDLAALCSKRFILSDGLISERGSMGA